ncbi:MAG TPA: hypothetical protein VLA37_04825 [Sphingomonadaceae bacterium]|nr:hypothetical protein [Sphingomonadaceae bacterium]
MEAELLKFGSSLLAISLLVYIAWRMRLGGISRIETEAQLKDLADSAFCGFEPVRFAIAPDGKGAICEDAAGRIILLVPHGSNHAARLLGRESSARREDSRLVVDSGDASFPVVSLELGEASRSWENRINSLSS